MIKNTLTKLLCKLTPLGSVVIGAGAAGIMMAAKIPRYFKDGQVELQVYEKNHEGNFEQNQVTHSYTDALSVH